MKSGEYMGSNAETKFTATIEDILTDTVNKWSKILEEKKFPKKKENG